MKFCSLAESSVLFHEVIVCLVWWMPWSDWFLPNPAIDQDKNWLLCFFNAPQKRYFILTDEIHAVNLNDCVPLRYSAYAAASVVDHLEWDRPLSALLQRLPTFCASPSARPRQQNCLPDNRIFFEAAAVNQMEQMDEHGKLERRWRGPKSYSPRQRRQHFGARQRTLRSKRE